MNSILQRIDFSIISIYQLLNFTNLLLRFLIENLSDAFVKILNICQCRNIGIRENPSLRLAGSNPVTGTIREDVGGAYRAGLENHLEYTLTGAPLL